MAQVGKQSLFSDGVFVSGCLVSSYCHGSKSCQPLDCALINDAVLDHSLCMFGSMITRIV